MTQIPYLNTVAYLNTAQRITTEKFKSPMQATAFQAPHLQLGQGVSTALRNCYVNSCLPWRPFTRM